MIIFSLMNLRQVTALIDFIMNTQTIKHKTRVIWTLEMAQTFSTSNSQNKIILSVDCFHLAPSVFVIPSICALHILESPIGLWTGGKVK
jgi:hypothetical protein